MLFRWIGCKENPQRGNSISYCPPLVTQNDSLLPVPAPSITGPVPCPTDQSEPNKLWLALQNRGTSIQNRRGTRGRAPPLPYNYNWIKKKAWATQSIFACSAGWDFRSKGVVKPKAKSSKRERVEKWSDPFELELELGSQKGRWGKGWCVGSVGGILDFRFHFMQLSNGKALMLWHANFPSTLAIGMRRQISTDWGWVLRHLSKIINQSAIRRRNSLLIFSHPLAIKGTAV